MHTCVCVCVCVHSHMHIYPHLPPPFCPIQRSKIDAELAAREEQKAVQAELKEMHEAAQWRKLKGKCGASLLSHCYLLYCSSLVAHFLYCSAVEETERRVQAQHCGAPTAIFSIVHC